MSRLIRRACVDRLAAELDHVGAAVNAHVGWRALATQRTPAGAVSLLAISSVGSAYVADGELRLFSGGEAYAPEGFARGITEPWLATLSFGGR